MDKRLKELEKKIGYTFENHKLLERAMMHSSYTNEKHLEKYRCNERLEFLGDAVLELISSEYLFGELPRVSEGELTKTRASMQCVRETLIWEVIFSLEKERKQRVEE